MLVQSGPTARSHSSLFLTRARVLSIYVGHLPRAVKATAVSPSVNIYIYCVYIYIYVRVQIYVCMYVCMYVQIYVNICMYIGKCKNAI